MTDKNLDDSNNAKLKGIADDLEASGRCLIIRAKSTGSWINVRGITVTGTVLAATEFRDLYAHIIM